MEMRFGQTTKLPGFSLLSAHRVSNSQPAENVEWLEHGAIVGLQVRILDQCAPVLGLAWVSMVQQEQPPKYVLRVDAAWADCESLGARYKAFAFLGLFVCQGRLHFV